MLSTQVRGPFGTHEANDNFLKKIDRRESTTDANMHSKSTTHSYGQQYRNRVKSSKVQTNILWTPKFETNEDAFVTSKSKDFIEKLGGY